MSKRRDQQRGCGCLIVVAVGLAAWVSLRQPEAAPVLPAPTTDVIAIEATSAAVEPTLKAALGVLPDLQGVRDVSAMMVDGAWYVNVSADIAGADDGVETMERIRAAITVQPVANLRVTSYVRDVPQRAWLWEDDKWTSAVAR